MTLEHSTHAFRLPVIARAQESGNVAGACREFSTSRSVLYRGRRYRLTCGPHGLHPRRREPRRGRPPLLSAQAERAIHPEGHRNSMAPGMTSLGCGPIGEPAAAAGTRQPCIRPSTPTACWGGWGCGLAGSGWLFWKRTTHRQPAGGCSVS